MKHFLTGILFCVLALGCFAQDEYVDSLKREVATSNDIGKKIELYGNIFDYYLNLDNIIADQYADTILIYSQYCNINSYAAANVCKGTVKYEIGDYAESVKYYGKAEKIARILCDTVLLCHIYSELGNIYDKFENLNLSKKHLTLAVINAKLLGDNDIYAATLVNIADLYYYKKQEYDTVLMLYERALNLTTILDTKIAIYCGIAKLQYSLGEIEDAQKTYLNVLSILDESVDMHIYLSALNNVSKMYIRENDIFEAEKLLAKVDSISSKVGFNEVRLTLYNNYHDLYKKKGDFKKANYYLEHYIWLRDSIYSAELSAQLKILENRNEREKSLLELRLRDEEISHQKNLNAILFSIIAIVLIFIAVIALLLVKKSRMNKMLAKLNADLKQRDEEISSNLDYAREIQLGCMSNSLTESNLQMFVLDRPKSVVGGDFYISQTKGDASYVVVGDCTGHGISGGFLSVLGIKSVYAAIEKYDTLPEIASFINNEFCEIVSSAENLKGESLCLSMVRICGNEVRFLGSKQKMWIVSGDKGDCSTARPLACKPEVHEYKSANAIMGSAVGEEFTEEIININSGDVVFLSSDGYPDQFGAEGKLKYSRFRALLQECAQMKPDKAKSFLSEKLDLWRGDLEQTDDVMVVGMYF